MPKGAEPELLDKWKVQDAVETAREQGLTRVEVTANPHALGFYEKVGFVRNGMTQTPFGPGHRMYMAVSRSFG